MRWFATFARWAVSAVVSPTAAPRYAIEHPALRGAGFTPEMLDSRVGR
jgi:hypothetical protein